ncbi:MBL fold metallo-hydrolase [Altibacter sp. HG106]|uniref:MBL fold metallo-hydrolase n=1 Tax=Altibacter sp. HG106 TaxID=3023937 RepID=UPI00235011DC|nr:MBL fold metallo-hydrolase [Altibacter sp. HG106]MDC7994798.1 MBL fold metallo-hydrolase [Altibacter sp. HG106]
MYPQSIVRWIRWCLTVLCTLGGLTHLTAQNAKALKSYDPYLIVLGTAQDAGAPQIGCQKSCCTKRFSDPTLKKQVTSLGIVDPVTGQTFLLEATPDIILQNRELQQEIKTNAPLPNGILLTHAHIGHYSGLQFLGKEATNATKIPVYVMPKMQRFLEENGPWSQLVAEENIRLVPMTAEVAVQLTPQLKITPHLVPHRDEFSETVAYTVEGPNTSVLFIPDIDKWERWSTHINAKVSEVDIAFLDATFYNAEEINNRDISQIPHPFVIETMKRFEDASDSEKNKIHFIHLNHTNPLLDPNSDASNYVISNGFRIARKSMKIPL